MSETTVDKFDYYLEMIRGNNIRYLNMWLKHLSEMHYLAYSHSGEDLTLSKAKGWLGTNKDEILPYIISFERKDEVRWLTLDNDTSDHMGGYCRYVASCEKTLGGRSLFKRYAVPVTTELFYKAFPEENKMSNKAATSKSALFTKMFNKMFKKVDGVVFDMMTNSLALVKDGSSFSVKKEGSEYSIVENLFDELTMPIPAFAQATTLEKIKIGDMVLGSNGEVKGWVVKVQAKSLRVLTPTSVVATVKPSELAMVGQGQTFMVVASMFTNQEQTNNMLPMLMMLKDEGDSSLDKLMPLMLMMNGQQQGDNMMTNMMPLLMMSGDADVEKLLPIMMMSNPQGNDMNAFGGMNPMMMLMLLNK